MATSPPPEPGAHKDAPAQATHPTSLHVNAWNLLLLIPLLMVITPWFNFDAPRLFGLPFYYWYQFAWVPVGVICVGLVYVKTKDKPRRVQGVQR